MADDMARYKELLLGPSRTTRCASTSVRSPSSTLGGRTCAREPRLRGVRLHPRGIEPDHLDHLRRTCSWVHHVNAGGSGSVRMRTYDYDLAALRVASS